MADPAAITPTDRMQYWTTVTYNGSRSPPHHPRLGQSLPVKWRGRRAGEEYYVVEMPDGRTQRVPSSWTTAPGEASEAGSSSVLHAGKSPGPG